MKKLICLLLSIVLICTLAACGGMSSPMKNESAYGGSASSSASSADAYWEEPDDYKYADEVGDYDGTTTEVAVSDRKIIYNVDVTAETKSFDQAKADVDDLVFRYHGYLESSDVSGSSYNASRTNRRLNYRIRVPAASLSDFLADLEQVVNITSNSTNMDDVTTRYIDTDARLNSLKQEEKRLLELLDQAENLEEVLQIEDRLSQVRYQIESMTSVLRSFDNEVSYSTVSLSLRDVTEYTVNSSFGSRISESASEGWSDFVGFLEDILLALIRGLPFLILLAVVALVIVLIVRRAGKRKKAKFPGRAPVAMPQPPQPPVEKQ